MEMVWVPNNSHVSLSSVDPSLGVSLCPKGECPGLLDESPSAGEACSVILSSVSPVFLSPLYLNASLSNPLRYSWINCLKSCHINNL